MHVIQKNVWAVLVLERINSTPEGAEHLKEAEAFCAQEGPQGHRTFQDGNIVEPAEAGPEWKRLYDLRGDEPAEAYACGEPAHDYADFLTTEWKLYGPEGE